MKFNESELGAVLAGLRLLQAAVNIPDDIASIQSDLGQTEPLGPADIDALCERLNAPVPADDQDLEDEIADFMRQRIEDGEWDLETDIPVRLARFGLMEPQSFVDEMHERMEDRAAEAAEDDE